MFPLSDRHISGRALLYVCLIYFLFYCCLCVNQLYRKNTNMRAWSCQVKYPWYSKYTIDRSAFFYLLVCLFFSLRFTTLFFLSDCNGIRIRNHLIRKRILNHLTKLVNRLSCVIISHTLFRMNLHFVVVNVKELFGRIRRNIWSLSLSIDSL